MITSVTTVAYSLGQSPKNRPRKPS